MKGKWDFALAQYKIAHVIRSDKIMMNLKVETFF